MSGESVGRTATLRGGHTMQDVDRLAKIATERLGGFSTDALDRYEAAWFGIVEAIYGADDSLTGHQLLFAGMNAIRKLVTGEMQSHGWDHKAGDVRPSFTKYWEPQRVSPSPENGVCERMALRQVLALLTAVQYEALAAAAVSPTLRAAAESLGISYNTFQKRYFAARRVIREAWYAPDSPRVEGPTATTCSRGHDKAKHQRTNSAGKPYCHRCERLTQNKRRREQGTTEPGAA